MYFNGWPELVNIRQPAAGQSVTYRFPGETYTAIACVRVTLLTSAAVANRFPGLAILDGDGVPLMRVVSPTAVAAATTRRTFWAHDIGGIVTSPSGDEALPFVDELFPPGFGVQIFADTIQAADQLSAIGLWLRRVPSGDMGPSTGSIPYAP